MKLPVALPGTSVANKTGSWRSERPIPLDKCIACGICVKFCPERCIQLTPKDGSPNKGKITIDYDYCKGCGICANECPVKAYVMKGEQEAKNEMLTK